MKWFLRVQNTPQLYSCIQHISKVTRSCIYASKKKKKKNRLERPTCYTVWNHNNDRVHGISCRYSDKTTKHILSHFSYYPTDFHETKRTYLLIIRSKRSPQSYFTVCYDGPNGSLFISILLHNSEFRILNSEFRNLPCEFRNSEL